MGIEGGQCVGLTTLPSSYADWKCGSLKLLELYGPLQTCRGDWCTFICGLALYFHTHGHRDLVGVPRSDRLLFFNRIQSRVVIGFLTRYNTPCRHLHLLRLTDSPLCRKCGADDESVPTFSVGVRP
jgi:hypothetical protein